MREALRYAQSRILVVGQLSDVENLTGLDGTDIGVRQGEYRDGAALSGNKLHFIGGVAVAMDYRPHVASHEGTPCNRPLVGAEVTAYLAAFIPN